MRELVETKWREKPLLKNFNPPWGLKEFVEYLISNRNGLLRNLFILLMIKTDIPVEIALQYNNSFSENVHSYVNNINTMKVVLTLPLQTRPDPYLKKYAEDSRAQLRSLNSI